MLRVFTIFFSIFFFFFVSLFFRFVLFRISLSDTCFLKSSPRSKTDCIYDNEHFDIKKSSLLHVGVDRVFVVHKTYRLCLFSFFFSGKMKQSPTWIFILFYLTSLFHNSKLNTTTFSTPANFYQISFRRAQRTKQRNSVSRS